MMHASDTRKPNMALSVAAVIAALALFLGVWLWQGGTLWAQPGTTAVCVVQVGDGRQQQLPLDVDTTVTYDCGWGTNTLRISKGAVCVVDADCANHTCMMSGQISQPGQQIVCLPHRFCASIEARAPEDTQPAGQAGTLDTVAR